MTVTYRNAGAWGAGSGAPLPSLTVDNNFWTVVQQIATLQSSLAGSVVSISNIAVNDTQMYVTLTNGSVLGPYTLPTASFNFRGTWQSNTIYSTNDIVTMNASVYIVTWPHTSAASFVAGANDGQGHYYYGLLLTSPGSSLPGGGTPGEVLSKSDATDYNVQWEGYAAPAGGTTGQVLQKVSSSDGDIAWTDTIPVQDALFPQDKDRLIYFDSYTSWVTRPGCPFYESLGASTLTLSMDMLDVAAIFEFQVACTVTLPSNTDVPFPVGALFGFRQVTNSAPVTLVAGSGATLISPRGRGVSSSGQGSVIWVQLRSPNQWCCWGQLLGAPEVTRQILATSGSVGFDNALGGLATIQPSADATLLNVGQVVEGAVITIVIKSSGTTPRKITFGTGFDALGPTVTGTVSGVTQTLQFVGDPMSNTWREISRTQVNGTVVSPTVGTCQVDPTRTRVHFLTPTGNCTVQAAAVTTNAELFLVVTTSGTTSYTITFDSPTFSSTGTLTTGTVTGQTFVLHFIGNGTKMLEVARTVAMA